VSVNAPELMMLVDSTRIRYVVPLVTAAWMRLAVEPGAASSLDARMVEPVASRSDMPGSNALLVVAARITPVTGAVHWYHTVLLQGPPAHGAGSSGSMPAPPRLSFTVAAAVAMTCA